MKKSAVMILANELYYKKRYSRPMELKRAWAMIKPSKFFSKAVGVSFGSRQAALMRLKKYAADCIEVILKHEPDNKHDKNAVAVLVSMMGGKEYKIGNPSSSIWTRLIDRQQVQAAFKSVTGGRCGQSDLIL